jgi:hypothetical protein
LFFLSGETKAQLLDSLRFHLSHKPVLDGNWETRNTFISTRRAQITGWKLGLDFNSKIRMGVGYNYMNTKFYNSEFSGFQYRKEQLGMRYFCVYFEYLYFKQNRWTFSVPVQVGFGTTFTRSVFPVVQNEKKNSHFIMVYEPCISGEYRLLPWFAIGAEGGFRLFLFKSGSVKERFTAPIYVFSASIKWGYFIDKYKLKDKTLKLLNQS